MAHGQCPFLQELSSFPKRGNAPICQRLGWRRCLEKGCSEKAKKENYKMRRNNKSEDRRGGDVQRTAEVE